MATEFIDGCCTIGDGEDAEPSAEHLLRQMDRLGIARAIINPPDRCFAWENEAGNKLVISGAEMFADRFIPAITVNPWRPDAVEIATKYIQAGERVLAFSPGVQGFILSERSLDAILEKVSADHPRIPVYVHTGHHSHAAPTQLGLLAGRFPGINFIMGHCGATDYSTDVGVVYRQHENIYLESSFARPPAFTARLKDLGYDRAIMGSGYPYNDLEFEWSEMRRLLPADYHQAVLGGNLNRLLGDGE